MRSMWERDPNGDPPAPGIKSNLTKLLDQTLGTPVWTNIDEFLEKFQTAFDPPPPPRPFLGKMLRFFPKFMTTSTEFATKFFRREMIPPPPIFKFFRKFMTKSAVSNAKRMQRNFLDQKRPPPIPFGNFPKIHQFWCGQASLSLLTHYLTPPKYWPYFSSPNDDQNLFWAMLIIYEVELLEFELAKKITAVTFDNMVYWVLEIWFLQRMKYQLL